MVTKTHKGKGKFTHTCQQRDDFKRIVLYMHTNSACTQVVRFFGQATCILCVAHVTRPWFKEFSILHDLLRDTSSSPRKSEPAKQPINKFGKLIFKEIMIWSQLSSSTAIFSKHLSWSYLQVNSTTKIGDSFPGHFTATQCFLPCKWKLFVWRMSSIATDRQEE